MSLFDDASLVLIPDGAKDGKLYSVKPTDGTGDFTFTRGSNLAATRVDENGLIEKGRENLLLQSNQFDTNWFINGTGTLTSGQSGYDGSSDAWLLSKSASSTYLSQSTPLSVINTFSVYAKAGTNTHLAIWVRNSNKGKYFDLVNGTIGSDFVGTPIDASIESVGNGWYRCSVTTNDASNNCRIYPADGDGDISGTSGSIYIQDAQLEVGLVATDYIETTTTTAVSGITEDLPRLDYSGGASCPSLLLEPQRTNIWLNSERVASWLLINASATSNTATSPSGYQDADTATATGTGEHPVYQNLPFVSGTTYTFSVFAKANTSNYIQMVFAGNLIANSYANFDLSNGTITASAVLTPKIEDYGNGWYRCSITATATGSTTNSQIIYLINSPTAPRSQSFTASGESVYLWGVQFEAGSYPTSYIPTYGTSVTRVNDFCSKNGVSDLIGQTEGTLFFDLNVTTIDANSFLFGVYGGGNEIYFRGLGSNVIRFIHYFGGTVAAISTPTLSEGRHKLAACYKNNDWVFYLDGVLVGSDTSGTFSGTINSISFGYTLGSVYQAFESVNQALLFKTRLSNTELAALTTI